MIISKMVKVKWHHMTRKHYESLGYKWTKQYDEFEVKVEDLSKGSNVKIQAKCDNTNCKNPVIKEVIWQNYKRSVDNYGKYYCNSCAKKLYASKNANKTKLKKSKSFYDWCYNNLSKKEADEIIARWNTEKNGCSPKDIGFSSDGINKKGYWFKCLDHPEHYSELHSISTFVNKNGKIDCRACNSIAQYLIDTYGKNALEKYWDYDKNNKLGLNPWKIAKGNNTIKIYIYCQQKDYHGSYYIKCNNFINDNRCPYCSHHKIHPKDSLGQYIIDNYGRDFFNKVWSDKNKKSPFKYAPNGHQEVWWKCPEEKHKDYYRRIRTSNVCNFRCPECTQEKTESILQNKVRLYLESLNLGQVLHEYNCTLIPINPKTNNQLPFDNEIISQNGKHLLIEVMGEQHYQICGWIISKSKHNSTTPEYELHKRQLYDRYKRFIAYKKGYEYLAIPYWIDNKQEDWKKLINNKLIRRKFL